MLALFVAFAGVILDASATGRVVRIVGGDSVAAPAAVVLLHRVGRDAQGVVDSVRTAPDGRFAFRFVRDSGATYLISARWSGIEYFAPPLVNGTPVDGLTIVVADTTSTAPVSIGARHVAISGPAPDGTRTVVDLVILQNVGTLTRVARDSVTPTWRMLLPAFAANVRVADSDFSPAAFDQHADTLMLFAAIPPGERQIFIDYQLPPGTRRFALPIDQPINAVNLLAEERVTITGAVQQVDTVVNERAFHRWTASLSRPGMLIVAMPRIGPPAWTIPLLVSLFAASLAIVGSLLVRPRAPQFSSPAASGAEIELLVDRIATLDVANRAGPETVGAAAWAEYLTQRATLRQELDRVAQQSASHR